MITVNREKAESTTIERLRLEREPLLVALDVEFMRAIEAGDDTQATIARKQALRDVTAKDISSLSLAQLAELNIQSALGV